MSDGGGYWIHAPENPFNQMAWTRGGGGYDNAQTHQSNALRGHAMSGSGAGSKPIYAGDQAGISAGFAANPNGGFYAMNGLGHMMWVADRTPITTPAPNGGSGAGAGVVTTAPDPVGTTRPTGPTGKPTGNGGGGNRPTVIAPGGSGAGGGTTKTKGGGATAGPGGGAVIVGQGSVPVPGSGVKPTGKTKAGGYKGNFTTQQVGPHTVRIDKNYPDVEDFGEPRYGEPGELVFGAINMAVDYQNNADLIDSIIFNDVIRVHAGGPADQAIKAGQAAYEWGNAAVNKAHVSAGHDAEGPYLDVTWPW